MPGQDLVVKTCPAGLVLWHDLRAKAGVPVMRDVDEQLAKVAFKGLLAFAVAGVASGVGQAGVLGVSQVLGHLGFQIILHRTLGQLFEPVVFSDEVL